MKQTIVGGSLLYAGENHGHSIGDVLDTCDSAGNAQRIRVVNVTRKSIIVEPVRRRLTGAQILAVAGTLSAIVGTIGGALGSPQIIGVASAIMLAGNLFAFNAERKRS